MAREQERGRQDVHEGNSGQPRRCGFVAVLGAPNTGKSTLVNRMVGAKVSIVSPKVQTTRSKVLGIVAEQQTQIILVDTPGVFLPRRRLDRAMISAAWNGAARSDEILLLVDSLRGCDTDTRRIVGELKSRALGAILVLNKVDLVNKTSLLNLAEELTQEQIFRNTFMISAKTGDGVDDLLYFVSTHLPESPWLFPEDQLTDMPNRILASEITREKLYLELRNELPYASSVWTESWVENRDGSVRIDQVILVERESQKAIVVGKGGRQIRRIGQRARAELEKLLERRVHLFLFVKVSEKWGDNPESYTELGLDFNS